MRASHLYLSSASHLHFPFHLSLVHLTSSPLNLSFASLIAPLTCTSDLHLFLSTFQLHLAVPRAPRSFTSRLHISLAHLSRNSHLDLSGSPLTRTSMLHIIFVCPLHICTLQMHRSSARFSKPSAIKQAVFLNSA